MLPIWCCYYCWCVQGLSGGAIDTKVELLFENTWMAPDCGPWLSYHGSRIEREIASPLIVRPPRLEHAKSVVKAHFAKACKTIFDVVAR